MGRSYRGWARWGVGDGQAMELWFLVAPLGDVTGRVKECHESAGTAARRGLSGPIVGARPDLAGGDSAGDGGASGGLRGRPWGCLGVAQCTDCGSLDHGHLNIDPEYSTSLRMEEEHGIDISYRLTLNGH